MNADVASVSIETPEKAHRGVNKTERPPREMRARRASEIEPTRVEWVWPGWIPSARLALLGGRPGDGKSAIAIDLAAHLSTASEMPDRYCPRKPIVAAILSGEDDPSDTIVPRLIAAKADRERVIVFDGTVVDPTSGCERAWRLPDDIPQLERLIGEYAIELIVIDPLTAFIAERVDTHRDASVRAMLNPLAQMASRCHCTVLGIRHHRKGGANDARDAGNGSIAFTAAARIEWTVGRDPTDPTCRVLAVVKSNIGKEEPSLAFRLVDGETRYRAVKVEWLGQTTVTASELVSQSGCHATARENATEFLATFLKDGPRPEKEIEEVARTGGISEPSLRRAKDVLHVRSDKRSGTKYGEWEWSLPPPVGQQCAGSCEREHLDHVEHLDMLTPTTVSCLRAATVGGFPRKASQHDQDDQGVLPSSDVHLARDRRRVRRHVTASSSPTSHRRHA